MNLLAVCAADRFAACDVVITAATLLGLALAAVVGVWWWWVTRHR